MAVTKPGYMLEHPSIRRYSPIESTRCSRWVVTIRSVRTISRKPKPQNDLRSVEDRRPIASSERDGARHRHLKPAVGRVRNEAEMDCGRPCLPGNRNDRKIVPDTKHRSPDGTYGWRPAGILRDCTPGPAREAGMIQSDPHGDMGSPTEMIGPVPPHNEFHVECEVTRMPKVAKFLVG